jgi:hypothetical protein
MSPPYRHAHGISSVPARGAGSTGWQLRPLLIPLSHGASEMTVWSIVLFRARCMVQGSLRDQTIGYLVAGLLR